MRFFLIKKATQIAKPLAAAATAATASYVAATGTSYAVDQVTSSLRSQIFSSLTHPKKGAEMPSDDVAQKPKF